MKTIKDIIKNPIKIPIVPSIAILILGSILILVGSSVVNFPFFIPFWRFAMENPSLVLLNITPIILSVGIIFFVSNNAIFSITFSGAFFAIFSIANSEKIRLRQDPLFPADVKLISELGSIASGFTLKQLALYIGIIFTAIIIIILAFVFFKSNKINKYYRIGGAILFCILGVLANNTIYSSTSLYNTFPVDGNQFFEVNKFGSKGFIYSFCYNFNSTRTVAPPGYKKEAIDAIESSFISKADTYNNKPLPHIIMIMGEAYTDMSENENLDFSASTDPMATWKTLKEGENAISGKIVVPNFGGGTSDTEFDVLTALPTKLIASSTNSYNLIRKEIDAIPARLKTIGYSTLAIHPGYSWFYNRANVYNYMGFDSFLHLESFQGSEKYSGGYIADKYATDSILENFENHIENNDNPLFEFIVTIQNHGPYDEKYNITEKTFEPTAALTPKEETLLNNYFMGVKDADDEIKRLTDYFESSNEPVVLVYFGDHRPGFSNGMDFFDLLDYPIDANGTPQEVSAVYQTPFMVWQNSSSKNLFSLKENAKKIQLEDNSIISANFLGSSVLELAEITEISPVMDFSNKLRREVAVISENGYFLPNGEFAKELPPHIASEVEKLKFLSYYKMFE